MNRQEIISQIHRKQSFLCVGLDSDIKKIPSHLLETEDPIFEFNRQIIDATKEFCVAYKPNLAFYESLGPKGMVSLEKTIKYISKDIFTIADAKRGDIGNTSELYARSFFEYYGFDSVTVAPYMGSDSVTPFLKIPGKWVILLALTSNEGALDFQMMNLDGKNKKLFEEVLDKSKEWGTKENTMYVVGATRGEAFSQVRKLVPENFLLVPGVGAQGGSLKEVVKFGKNKDCGLLVNSSRNILYADSGKSFADAAAEEAFKLQKEMRDLL